MPEDSASTRSAETRKLAAIMFTDIVGFSRQMGADEARMLRLLEMHNRRVHQLVAEQYGQIIKSTGDGFLVHFSSVVHAVQCAQQIQSQFRSYNAVREPAEQIHLRIGIHLGEIVEQPDGDVQGDGVNIAARLQPLAEPDTICISQKVYEEVAKKLPLGTMVSLGRPKLKNIAQRFPVYILFPDPPKGLRQTLRVQQLKLKPWHRTGQVVLLLVLLLGAGVLSRYLYVPAPAGLPLPDKPSIVVLPFTNMSGDPGQEYLSDGITEDLTTDLSRLSGLFVIARHSAFSYKGKTAKVEEVGKELGVQYVLEGSVRKTDKQVRINAQLIDATSGHHLWAERYDRPLQEIFAVQDEIRQQIVTTLKLQLSLWEQGKGVYGRPRTDNLEAYDCFLRGAESYLRFTKEANAQARQLFERATALDPQYAGAHAFLGMTYLQDWTYQWSPDPQNLERAFTLMKKAVTLDDSLPFAHRMLSFVYGMRSQFDQALGEAERTIALDPNDASAYATLAAALNSLGRPEEAITAMEKAMRLNPRSLDWYWFTLGISYRFAGRYEEALAAQKQALSRNPASPGAYAELASSYGEQWLFQLSQDPQTIEQAMKMAQKEVALNDSFPFAHTALGLVYLWNKQPEQALGEAERAIALNPNAGDGYTGLAHILNSIGRPEEAIATVEKGLRCPNRYTDWWHVMELGRAYYLTGQYEEALATLKKVAPRLPNYPWFRLILAATYSELGREKEARAEAAELLQMSPQFSLEVARQRLSFTEPATLERHLAALRRAGLK